MGVSGDAEEEKKKAKEDVESERGREKGSVALGVPRQGRF